MAPFASSDSFTVRYDSFSTSALSQSSVLANDFDMEMDPLTAVLNTDVSHGTLTLNSNGHFVYEPDAGYVGNDSITYKAFDGTGYSSAATVSLTVTSAFAAATNLDDLPTAAAQNMGASASRSSPAASRRPSPSPRAMRSSTVPPPIPVPSSVSTPNTTPT